MKRFRIALSLIVLSLFTAPAFSADIMPPPPQLTAKNFILMDAFSGQILASKNPDEKIAPASLTKIMTEFVTFNELENGHLHLDDEVTISQKAWRTGGSRMFVEVNKKVTVENLLQGIIIQSGNDASVAVAEHIAGDEATFAQLMNQTAKRLGMNNTHFTNSMGLPTEDHYTTAHDLAILSKALITHFPEYYKWHSQKEFTFNKIKQYNRNRLLWRDETVDGVKTGFTEAAGYCLVASAVREGMRLISVVMGTSSPTMRTNENQTLLNYGFRFYETRKLYEADTAISEPRVWKGETKILKVGVSNDLFVTLPRNNSAELKATVDLSPQIIAPVSEGETLGKVHVQLGDNVLAERPLIALEPIAKGSLFRRLYDEALLMIE